MAKLGGRSRQTPVLNTTHLSAARQRTILKRRTLPFTAIILVSTSLHFGAQTSTTTASKLSRTSSVIGGPAVQRQGGNQISAEPAEDGLTSTNSGLALSGGAGVGVAGINDVTGPKFGLLCDGGTDETAKLQAVAAAGAIYIPPGHTCVANTGVIDLGGLPGSGKPIQRRAVQGGGTIRCSPSTRQSACVRMVNAQDIPVYLNAIICNANVAHCLEVSVGETGSNETANFYINNIGGGQIGAALGTDTTMDLSHYNFWGTKFSDQTVAGIMVGNGSQGNVLDGFCYACTFDVMPIALDINGGSMALIGGGADHVPTLVQVDQVTDNPISVRDFRVEGASQLVNNKTLGNSYIGALNLDNVTDAGLPQNANCSTLPPMINWNSSAPVHMSNVRISNACGKVSFNIGHDRISPTPLFMNNVGVNDKTFPEQLQSLFANGRVLLFSTNDVQVQDSGSGISAGSGRTYSSSPVSSPAISTGNAGNSDAVGALVIPSSAMSVSRTFTDSRAYTVAPTCFTGNVSCAIATATTSTMTITGPAGSVVSYLCVRRD